MLRAVAADASLPPISRPPDARPRSDHERSAEEPDPPSPAELAAVERQLVRLAELLGASATEDRSLGGLFVEWPGRGPAFNHLSRVRWRDPLQPRLEALRSRLAHGGNPAAIVVAQEVTRPAELGARLVEDGWLPLVRERVMWTRRAAVVPHLDPTMRVEAVTRSSAPEYERVEREIFGLSASDAPQRVEALAGSIEAGTQRAYLVRVQGGPVATARLVPGERIAALHGIGVLPGQRRQGYGTLVTTVATRAALALGARLVWLSVAEGNVPAELLYSALDYRPAFAWQLLVDTSAG
jgi:ribosomal protein S18 acetylase RimI-like enzyme